MIHQMNIVNKFMAAECGRHGMSQPACNNPTLQTFIAGHCSCMIPHYSNRLPSLKFAGDTFSVSPFSPRTWGALLLVGWATFLLIFWCFWEFSFSTMGQHVSDGSCDLATLTFNLRGHGTYLKISLPQK